MTWTITTTTTISASRAVTLAERIPSEPIKFVVLHPGTGAGGTVTIWDDLGRSVASTRIDSLSPRHEAEFFSDRSIFNVSAAIDGNATLSGAGVSVYLVSREAPEPSIADGSTSFAGTVKVAGDLEADGASFAGPVVAPNFSSLRYDMPVTRRKLADVASGAGEFVIGVVGDSHNLAVGGGSGGTYLLNDAARFAPSFIAGRQIAGKYGVPVSDDGWWGWRGISGLVSLSAFDPRWVLTGTWGAASSAGESFGYGALRATSDGATATYTATRDWNVCEIWMQQNTGATGAAVASAVGATDVTLTLLGEAPTLAKFTLTKSAVNSNPLVITATTAFSNYVGIAAINFRDSTKPAVRIQNHGMSGRTMSDHIIATKAYSTLSGYQVAGLSADLIVAEVLHNSIKAAAQTKAVWLAAWETFLSTLDTASRDILVYIGYPGNYDWATDGTMDDWIAGLKEKLDARQINMVDLREIFGASWSAGNVEGLMYDADHPNKRGLALYGAKMARDILSMSAPW